MTEATEITTIETHQETTKYNAIEPSSKLLVSLRCIVRVSSLLYLLVGGIASIWLSLNVLLDPKGEYTRKNKVCFVSLTAFAFIGSLPYIGYALFATRGAPSKRIGWLKIFSKWMLLFYILVLTIGVLIYFFSSSIYDILSDAVLLEGFYSGCWVVYHILVIKPYVKEAKKLIGKDEY